MKCFVAGGTGVIGRRVVPLLVADGHDVTVSTRSDDGDACVTDAGARPVRLDLFDPEAVVVATAAHDVIVNLATSIPPLRRAVRRSAWATNERIRTEGVDNLVAAAEANGVSRVVQESVTFMYTDAGDRWITEAHPRTATGDGAPVAHAERRVEQFGEGGGIGIVLRFGLFYDLDSDHTATHAALVRRRIDPFIGDHDSYLALTGVPAAARGVVAALSGDGGTFNVVDDDPPTRRDVADEVATRLGSRRLLHPSPGLIRKLAPEADTQMRSQRVSNRAMRASTGWRPDCAGAEGLVDTLVGRER